MTHSLKLDWSRDRIDTVNRALRQSKLGVPPAALTRLRAELDLEPLLDEQGRANMEEFGATIKANLTPRMLDDLETALAAAQNNLERLTDKSRDNDRAVPTFVDLMADLAQIHAARREIREYRATVAAIGRNS